MAEIPINYLKYIDKDGTEKKVYPITVTDAVYDSDGNKLSNVLLGVLKDTDISNVQSDSTTTVPSSALLKATDDKIGDTSSLPGDAGNVVSAINQLNSDSGWLTISTPYEPIKYRKSGKIVEFYFWNDKTIPISTDIATIPDGYRPSIPSYPNMIFISDAYGGGGRIVITNEGIVISGTEISGSAWSFFMATWICD